MTESVNIHTAALEGKFDDVKSVIEVEPKAVGSKDEVC